jgi:hypothetical protein
VARLPDRPIEVLGAARLSPHAVPLGTVAMSQSSLRFRVPSTDLLRNHGPRGQNADRFDTSPRVPRADGRCCRGPAANAFGRPGLRAHSLHGPGQPWRRRPGVQAERVGADARLSATLLEPVFRRPTMPATEIVAGNSVRACSSAMLVGIVDGTLHREWTSITRSADRSSVSDGDCPTSRRTTGSAVVPSPRIRARCCRRARQCAREGSHYRSAQLEAASRHVEYRAVPGAPLHLKRSLRRADGRIGRWDSNRSR